MPAGIGASYRSLGDLGEDVYKSTTIVEQTQTTGQSMLESVKKAFSFASPKIELRKKDPLIEDRRENISIVTRYVHITFRQYVFVLKWWRLEYDKCNKLNFHFPFCFYLCYCYYVQAQQFFL